MPEAGCAVYSRSPFPTMSTGIEDLTARAKQLIAERSYQEAVRACRRVLLSRPDEAPVRILLGKALLALRRFDEVRAEMMAVLRSEPNEPTAHRILGEAHLRAGDPQKARDCVKRALELDPSDEEARDLLGEIDEETAPVSATIDRWFDPEAVATLQTEPPPFEDEHTGPQPHARHFDQQTSIEVDPSLTARAALAEAEADQARTHALPPPVRTGPARTKDGLGSIPPPPASRPPSAGPPRRSMPRAPAAPLSSAPPASSMPPPSRSSSSLPPSASLYHYMNADTAAHRPAAKRDDDHPLRPPRLPGTDELSLDDVHSVDSMPDADELLYAVEPYDSLDDLEGEPTVARADALPPVEDLEGEATLVRPVELEEDPYGLDERTVLRSEPASRRPPSSRAPSSSRPPGARPYPSTYGPGRFPEDPIRPPAGVDPWEATPPPPVRPQAQLPPPSSIPARTPAASRNATPTPHGLRAGRRLELVREWLQSRRLMVVAIGCFPLLLGIGAFFGVRAWMRSSAEDEVRAAAVAASNDGLRTSLDRAIEIAEGQELDDPESVALRARLVATAVLEHGVDRGAEVEQLLAELSEDDRDLPDARTAEAYLLLSRGEVAAADSAARRGNGTNAELWRARVLTAIAANDVDRAAQAAEQAVRERPTSPRHLALHALVMALNRDVGSALTLLDSIQGGERSPAVRVARARIKLDSGSNPSEAAEEARSVIEDLGTIASAYEKAWAHLVRAQHASSSSERGSRQLALAQAEAAAQLRPRWDEGLALSLAETFLRLGEPGKAREVLTALPEQPREERRRATLLAEVAVAHGDWDAAEPALERAGESAATAWLRGRVLEGRGRTDEAKAQYDRALNDRGQSVRARARLGALALAEGHPARAIELLTPALEVDRANLDVVTTMVRAMLATDRADDADDVVTTALRLRGDAVELLSAKAQVDLAQGQVEDALTTLRQVVEQRPDDGDLRATLGEAARRAGQPDVAREAYDAALARDDDNHTALVGLAHLAAEEGDEAAIEAAIARAEGAGAGGPGLDRVRAQVMVLKGAGQEAIESLERLAESNRDDAELWTALGRAQVQAELDSRARRSFSRALQIDDENPEAHLGMAMLQTRAGQLHSAAQSIGRAERSGRARGLGPPFEARVIVARGRVQFEVGELSDAKTLAQQALEKDPEASEAHLLLAAIAIEREDDPISHLRRAVEGRAPLPEALGRLSIRVRGQEACDLARRYMRAAPEGYDAPDVQDVLDRCR